MPSAEHSKGDFRKGRAHETRTGLANSQPYGGAHAGLPGPYAQLTDHSTDGSTPDGASRPVLNPPSRKGVRVQIPSRAHARRWPTPSAWGSCLATPLHPHGAN
jgi:hypothetical protein